MGRILLTLPEETELKNKIQQSGTIVSICVAIAICSFLAGVLTELQRGTFLIIGTNIAEAYNAFSTLSQILLIVFGVSLFFCILFVIRYSYLVRRK